MSTVPAIGALISWTPASNAERTAVTRFGASSWLVEAFTPSFRGPSLQGQACVMVVPANAAGLPTKVTARRWVPVSQINA